MVQCKRIAKVKNSSVQKFGKMAVYSQLSACWHLAITHTPIIPTSTKSRAKINYRRLTEINSSYYGLSLMRTLTWGPHSVRYKGVDCNRGLKLYLLRHMYFYDKRSCRESLPKKNIYLTPDPSWQEKIATCVNRKNFKGCLVKLNKEGMHLDLKHPIVNQSYRNCSRAKKILLKLPLLAFLLLNNTENRKAHTVDIYLRSCVIHLRKIPFPR